MTAPHPILRSVRDAALDLINAAETLREMRETTLATRDAWDAKREAHSRKILTLRFGEMDQ